MMISSGIFLITSITKEEIERLSYLEKQSVKNREEKKRQSQSPNKIFLESGIQKKQRKSGGEI